MCSEFSINVGSDRQIDMRSAVVCVGRCVGTRHNVVDCNSSARSVRAHVMGEVMHMCLVPQVQSPAIQHFQRILYVSLHSY